MELHKRRSIELAQLCQDQKRKEHEKLGEINEVQKMIRLKNESIEDWKTQVRAASEANERIKRTKKDKVNFKKSGNYICLLLVVFLKEATLFMTITGKS